MRINKQIQARLGHPKATIKITPTSSHGFQNDTDAEIVMAVAYSFADFTHKLLHDYVKYIEVLTWQEFHNYVKYFGIDNDSQFQQVYDYVKYFEVLTCQEGHYDNDSQYQLQRQVSAVHGSASKQIGVPRLNLRQAN
jgi:hypothetical protein